MSIKPILNGTKIKSPLSDIVVSEYDPVSKETTRRVCKKCLKLVTSKKRKPNHPLFFDKGVGDPLYFIAAGVKFCSLVVPHHGTVAYTDINDMKRFMKRFSKRQMQSWTSITGTPFPYKLFK